MCTVSMIGDHYNDKWTRRWTELYPYETRLVQRPITPDDISHMLEKKITRKEFEELKKEVREMKELLIRAKIYDESNGEPNCEMEAKVALLKKVAELVGVDLKDIFPND